MPLLLPSTYATLLLTMMIHSCLPPVNSHTDSPAEELSLMILEDSEDTPIADYVVDLYQDRKGHLWIGTVGYGVAQYDGATLRYWTVDDGLPGSTVSSIAEDSVGNIWLGGHQGLSYHDGQSIYTVMTTSGRHNSGEGWVSVHSDATGRIWVSTRESLYQYRDSALAPIELPIDTAMVEAYSISAGRVGLDLHDSRGRYWYSSDGQGLLLCDPSPSSGTAYTHYTKADGLPSNTINEVVEDDYGRIWIGCMQAYQPYMTGDGGIAYWDGTEWSPIDHLPGLHKTDIYTLYVDSRGTLWAGATGHGIYSYRPTAVTPDSSGWHLYAETDRMDRTHSLGTTAVLLDRDTTLWIGMSGGLFQLREGQIRHVSREELSSGVIHQ